MGTEELQGFSDQYSLRGMVFNSLREDILRGRYKEKEELKEVAIGRELGVSRTPVREALRQLELEGLVAIIPNKGAYVSGISDKDIEDIFAIRTYLEGLAAAWACANITREQLDQMEENVFLTEFNVRKGNFDQVVELDSEFHKLLYASSGSRILTKLLTDYHYYAKRIRNMNLHDGSRAQNSTDEHKLILEAIKAGDAAAAEKYAGDHIRASIESIHRMEEEQKEAAEKGGETN